jgi:hypothetical protein
MIMKKLIAIAVVFALAAGGVFAADLGASVFGKVNLLEGNTIEKADDDLPGVFGSGTMGRLRLEGSGENDDGTFGAWIRLGKEGWQGGPTYEGLAWWKPIDQFKLAIGGNSDGLYGKEGYAGWMFHQTANDSGVVGDDQAWGAPYAVNGETMRDAFYGGFGGQALMLEIKPVDMFGLNIILPYFQYGSGDQIGQGLGEVFKNMTIQVDVNMDFGNIALTFAMAPWTFEKQNDKIGGKFYLFFGLTAIENLDLAFSVGFGLPSKVNDESTMDPIAIGLAAKYAINDAFGLKARVMAKFGGKSFYTDYGEAAPVDKWAAFQNSIDPVQFPYTYPVAPLLGAGLVDNPFGIIFDVLPYYAISDSFTVFADIGINMMSPKGGDSILGFHFNPYIQIGNEWGPSFFAGVKVYTKGKDYMTDKTPIYFAVPIGLEVSF